MDRYSSESTGGPGGPRYDPQGDPYEDDRNTRRGGNKQTPYLTRPAAVDLLRPDERRKVQEELAAQYGRQQDPNSVIADWQNQLIQQAADEARPMGDDDPSNELMRSSVFAASMQDTPQEKVLSNWVLAIFVVCVITGLIALILISINWGSASNDSKLAAGTVVGLAVAAVFSYGLSDYKFKQFA